MNLLGIEATAKNIMGNKSQGVEDTSSYKHWRKALKPGRDILD